MKKDLKYYMSLPYKVEIFPSPEGGYAARVTDLPGCITCAETWDELLFMIEDAKRCWLENTLADGMPVPEPAEPPTEKIA